MKACRIIHRIFSVIPFVILGIALIFFLFSYNGLPERIGVHFGADGDFDVYSYKIFGFYPFAAGFGLIILFTLGGFIAGKIKTGMKVTEHGDAVFRMVIKLYADFMCIGWAVFFTRWVYSVITQTPNDIAFLTAVSFVYMLSIPAIIILCIIVRIIYKK